VATPRSPDSSGTRRLAAAVVGSAAIVLSAPFAGEARTGLRTWLGPAFPAVIGGLTLLIVTAAVGAALRRARGGASPRQYGLAAVALAVAASYVALTGSADRSVLAVEAFHFVQYGAITWLFHRAWRRRPDASAVALPFLTAFVAGVVEEWYQWFLPARVGELGDVLLNSVAIGCALAVSVAAAPPRRFWPIEPAGRLAVHRATALAVVALAAFIHVVHLGVRITDGSTTFDSRFTPDALTRLATARTVEWAIRPPLVRPPRFSREDQYATEGLQHVTARNAAWEAGDVAAAFHENLILERYFAPVLDAPSYVSKIGHRWSSDHRAAAARATSASQEPFVSRAYPYSLYLWPPWALWIVALAAAGWLVRRTG
jgi:hypothetical protein